MLLIFKSNRDLASGFSHTSSLYLHMIIIIVFDIDLETDDVLGLWVLSLLSPSADDEDRSSLTGISTGKHG